jgi:hypothetical protein
MLADRRDVADAGVDDAGVYADLIKDEVVRGLGFYFPRVRASGGKCRRLAVTITYAPALIAVTTT